MSRGVTGDSQCGCSGRTDDVDVRSIFLTLEIKVLTEHAGPPAPTQVARAGGRMSVHYCQLEV
jgi:hypothetical protein